MAYQPFVAYLMLELFKIGNQRLEHDLEKFFFVVRQFWLGILYTV